MTIFDLLKGKKAKVMTDARVEVELTIESAKLVHHSVETGPPTPENDWWPPTNEWVTLEVTFTNGFKKSYDSLDSLKLEQCSM